MNGGRRLPIGIKKIQGGKSFEITGSYSKEEVHAKNNPLLHMTTLILPVKIPKGEGGQCSVVLANKAPRILKLEKNENTNEIFYDCAGGHIDKEDLGESSLMADTLFDNIVYQNGAVRELGEEILIYGRPACSDNLIPFRLIEYGPADMPEGGVNYEISMVYLLVCGKVENVQRDLVIRDDCKSADGKVFTRNFALTEFTFDEFLEKYRNSPNLFLDGIGRIAKDLCDRGITSQDFLAEIVVKARTEAKKRRLRKKEATMKQLSERYTEIEKLTTESVLESIIKNAKDEGLRKVAAKRLRQLVAEREEEERTERYRYQSWCETVTELYGDGTGYYQT